AGGGHALGAEPGLGGLDLLAGPDLHAEVVERPAALAFDEHQLERRVGDGEVGVARLPLGGLGGEELRVEVDGLVEVGHVEGELDSGHLGPPGARVTYGRRSMYR